MGTPRARDADGAGRIGLLAAAGRQQQWHELQQPGGPSEICTPAWSTTLTVPAATAMPVGDHLFVPDVQRRLKTFRLSDGVPEWQSTAQLPANAASQATNGQFVYVSAGRQLLAFPAEGCGAATCAPVWTAALPASAAGNLAVAGGVVYVGMINGVVTAFAADGCGGATTCPAIASVTAGSAVTAVVVSNAHLLVTTRNPEQTVAFAPASVP